MISDHANETTTLFVSIHQRALSVVGGLEKIQNTIRFEMSDDSSREGRWTEVTVNNKTQPGTSFHWIGATIVKDILQRQGATIARPSDSNQVVEIVFPERCSEINSRTTCVTISG